MTNQLRYIFSSLRLQQWIKNFFLYAALIFSGNLFHTDLLLQVTFAFILFSITASGIYVLNDLTDLEADKLHPEKSKRPLPAGNLSPRVAIAVCLILILAGVAGSVVLRPSFALVVAAYVVVNVLYSFVLKNVVILDVMTISAGFVLRVIAGAVVIDVPTSEWLLICTVLLSLFLGFSKRRHELTVLENEANAHRSVLRHYSPYFLDQMIGIVTASTVMSYALYAISDETVKKFGTNKLIYTVPFVLYGIFRYLYLVHRKVEGGNPTRLALTDAPLLVNIMLWILAACIIIYGK